MNSSNLNPKEKTDSANLGGLLPEINLRSNTQINKRRQKHQSSLNGSIKKESLQ